MTQQAKEHLEDERWRLENSYGLGPVHDGSVRDRISEIDRVTHNGGFQMTRRSAIPYRDALCWLLKNDDTSFLDFDADDASGTLSVAASLVADIYSRTDVEIVEDLERERDLQERAT